MIFVERACEDGDYTGGATEKGPCFGLNRSVARARRQRAVPLLHRNRSLQTVYGCTPTGLTTVYAPSIPCSAITGTGAGTRGIE